MNKPASITLPEQTDYRARFTTVEFLRMADLGAAENIRLELVHGELDRMNPPMTDHSHWQGEVYFQLRKLLEGAAAAVHVEIGIDLGDDTVLGCDVAVTREAIEVGKRLLRPDELLFVVEVAMTTLARDLGMKRAEYARADIPTYWVVDGEHRVVKVFSEPADGDYGRLVTIPFDDPLSVPGSDGTILLG